VAPCKLLLSWVSPRGSSVPARSIPQARALGSSEPEVSFFDSSVPPSEAPRRIVGAALLGIVGALLGVGAASAQGSLSAGSAAGSSAEKTAVFSAGDARFLQSAFEAIRYKGISNIEVGRLGDSTRAVRVTYNPARCSYKALLGAYWRNVDPTTAGSQFGNVGAPFRTVVWVADDSERKLAEKSRQLMEESSVYGPRSENGQMKGGAQGKRKQVAFVTEVSDMQGVFTATPEDGQDFCKLKPQEYKELFKKTGRYDYFTDHFAPVNTTACQDGVCGYVYFPCINQCMNVTNGDW
ncbi:unnamed protein product, partial [Polarella glacialis]